MQSSSPPLPLKINLKLSRFYPAASAEDQSEVEEILLNKSSPKQVLGLMKMNRRLNRYLDSENKSSPKQVLGLMKMNRRLNRYLDSENKSSPKQVLGLMKMNRRLNRYLDSAE
ncbi:hypothetical protein QL285_038978 [Trifolium repens]|nr:hypothetical protein QL285_038978 [Trifolium repens]